MKKFGTLTVLIASGQTPLSVSRAHVRPDVVFFATEGEAGRNIDNLLVRLDELPREAIADARLNPQGSLLERVADFYLGRVVPELVTGQAVLVLCEQDTFVALDRVLSAAATEPHLLPEGPQVMYSFDDHMHPRDSSRYGYDYPRKAAARPPDRNEKRRYGLLISALSALLFFFSLTGLLEHPAPAAGCKAACLVALAVAIGVTVGRTLRRCRHDRTGPGQQRPSGEDDSRHN